jgi:Fur family ferric uptake transcriptional regulator
MRATKQRDCIHEILSHSQFALSAEELLDLCQKQMPNLGIATIHRELKRLRDDNKLEEVQIPHDPIRFCLTEKHHHHHFKCNDCNKVYDIACSGVDVSLPKGFKKAEHEVNIFGTCKACAH